MVSGYHSAMTYEYRRVPWEQVDGLAAQGWRLMSIPPMPEMKNLGLGQVQMTGTVLFFMEREAPSEADGEGVPVGERTLVPPLSALRVTRT